MRQKKTAAQAEAQKGSQTGRKTTASTTRQRKTKQRGGGSKQTRQTQEM